MRSSSLASVDITEFHTFEAHTRLGLTRVKYNINKLSTLEKQEVIIRIKRNIPTVWEEMC